jgi:type IV secretory pathway TraG/TraD family ATPase VirD4
VPEFDPLAFVTSTGDTLYALSMEGRAAATSLTTALAAMVFDAGQLAASRTPSRRLPVPLLFVLDEAANVCRIRQLPDLYSHFGSRGMPVITILQSWSQGCEVFGEAGMKKLWSAANAKLYLGGVSEAGFLRDLSSVVGEHDVQRWSTSSSRNGASRSQSWSRESILTVADLQALDRGRAVLLTSGNPAALIATIPWMAGPDADNIRASVAFWAPHEETVAATGWGSA